MAAPTFDSLLGALLLHGHAAGDVSGLPPTPLADTRANILAATPDADGQLGFATDTLDLFVGVGALWFKVILSLQEVATGTHIGALNPAGEDLGYGEYLMASKLLQNSGWGYFDETIRPVFEGAKRYSKTLSKEQVYQSGQWRSLLALTSAEEDDLIKWSDFDALTIDGYGLPIIHGHQVDQGAFSSEHLISGGTF